MEFSTIALTEPANPRVALGTTDFQQQVGGKKELAAFIGKKEYKGENNKNTYSLFGERALRFGLSFFSSFLFALHRYLKLIGID